MKKVSMISIFVLLLISVGSIVFYINKNQNKYLDKESELMMEKEEVMVKEDEVMMEEEVMADEEAMMQNESRYIAFTPEVLSSSKDTRRVLYFYAKWCPTCIPANKGFIEKMSLIPEDVTVIRVNYKDTDTDQAEKDLAEKYQVSYQHIFIQIDEGGNEVTKWSGGGIDELLENIK
jgi:thiol-disulfide isomerase/thioredoxin